MWNTHLGLLKGDLMKFVSRTEWKARPSKNPLTRVSSTKGTKVHYEGAPVPSSLQKWHGDCFGHMRDLQTSHLANTKENYNDIAYNAVVCPHGWVFEGRGAGRKTGANGNSDLNLAHYAVCGMVGTAGIIKPTSDMLHGIRDAIEWLRADGNAGPEIKGHRDGYSTSCPGPDLYDWVQRGAPRPGVIVEPEPEVPVPERTKMAYVSKSLPNVEGDSSVVVFTVVPGEAWLNVSADYLPNQDMVTVRYDLSDGSGNWVQVNQLFSVGNGVVANVRLPFDDRIRVLSIKRLDNPNAAVDVTVHHPKG